MTAQRLPSSALGALVSDARGELWLNINDGLVRLGQQTFDAAVDDPSERLQYQLYDTADGVAGVPIVKLLARRDNSGRLWFARGGALTSVSPDHLSDPVPPLPRFVRIESRHE